MEHNQKFLRKRKMLLVLPVLVTPFLVLLFWALGGGHDAAARANQRTAGLDLTLPGMQQQEEPTSDKLGFYQQAEQDSVNHSEQLRNDPYGYRAADTGAALSIGNYPGFADDINTLNTYTDPNEERVHQKLAELQRQMEQGQQTPPTGQYGAETSDEMARLRAMMQGMEGRQQADPEMQQLNSMLEKILYIEHPEIAREKIREQSMKNKKQVYTVTTTARNTGIELMKREGDERNVETFTVVSGNGKPRKRSIAFQPAKQNDFYELNGTTSRQSTTGNVVEAEIAETATLVSGSTVKMKLLNDIYINGAMIPKEQFIYGTCNINGDRLLINLNSVRYGNSIFPVELSAYDVDGIAGINVPDAVSRQVAKGSTGQAINGIDVFAYDNSVKGQAISAGVQAAKGLFSRKAQIIRVTVRDGYRVFLKNGNEL